MLGVWIPAATDLSRLNRKCSMLGIRCECHGSSEMTIINGCPCRSRCDMLKNPHCSMAISAEHTKSLQTFTGNGDVSLWVKNSRVRRKKKPKQTNQDIFKGFFIICQYGHWNDNKIVFSDVSTLFVVSYSDSLLMKQTHAREHWISAQWLRSRFDWLIDFF